jgi:hypothetical protein
MHLIVPLIISIVLLSILVIWLWRARKRAFTSIENEIKLIKPVDATMLEILRNTAGEANCIESLSQKVWGHSRGLRGFFVMMNNTRVGVRLVGQLKVSASGRIDEEDVKFLRDMAFSLRTRIPIVFLESLLPTRLKVPRLHALQAARVYCEFFLYLEELADFSGSKELNQLCNLF